MGASFKKMKKTLKKLSGRLYLPDIKTNLFHATRTWTTRSIRKNPLSIWPVETEGYTLIAQKRVSKTRFSAEVEGNPEKMVGFPGRVVFTSSGC